MMSLMLLSFDGCIKYEHSWHTTNTENITAITFYNSSLNAAKEKI
jgi:hypothetical protein